MNKTKQLFSAMMSVTALALPASKLAAATLAFQGFDSTAADTWTYAATTDAPTGVNYSVTSTSLSTDTPKSSRVISGSSFQVTTNIDTEATTADPSWAQTATLTFGAVDVTGATGLQVKVPVAGISTTGSNGMDSGDFVKVYVALNGAAFSATPDLQLNGNSNATWGFTATGSLTTTAGTSKTMATAGGATGISSLYVNIPDGTTSVALMIQANDNSNKLSTGTAEIWALDSISLTGTVPEPASLGLLGVGATALLSRRRVNKR